MNTKTTQNLTALIVDDEKLARRGLQRRLDAVAGIEVVGEARNAREAVEAIREKAPDVVFLDIQMPGKSGFEVIRELGEEKLPAVVFVTAFDEYAVQAFDVNAVDYLLKPIEMPRLREALQRVRERIGARQEQAQRRRLLKVLSELTGKSVRRIGDLQDADLDKLERPQLARLAIKDGGKTTWVRQEDIEWIEAAGDYMCVHALGETHIMRKTMKELEQELDADFLQRIHRSTIVNVRQVTEMQSHINGEYFLTLESGHMVKLSRTYKDKLRHLQPG